MAAVKPKDRKDDLQQPFSLSLSLERASPLSLMCPGSVSVCVINRESHSLFILFRSLEVHLIMSDSLNNYLLEPTSLGVPNNPSAPPLVGTLPPLTNRRVTQWWVLFP